MIKHGQPPYLECSSRGDKRFSAFHARPESLNGRSIEEAYQAMKVFADGATGLTWRQANGKQAVNMAECQAWYRLWWKDWIREQGLRDVLMKATGLSDMFGQPERICQATVLWELRSEYILNEFEGQRACKEMFNDLNQTLAKVAVEMQEIIAKEKAQRK
jgi:hypothetical protein